MPMSLEEIEAQLHRQAGLPEKKMLSLAEVEAALMGINGRPQQLPIHPTTEAVYREETIAYLEQEAALREQEALLYHRERKRREKQRKLVEMVIFLISCLTFFINNPLINLIYLKLVQI
jgi:hypothetical protein